MLKISKVVIQSLKYYLMLLSITNCGWETATTKERLNALPNVRIQQKKGIWYLNDVEWDGKLIDVV